MSPDLKVPTEATVNVALHSVFKLEMVNPVRNKLCNHHYDEEAILSLIRNKEKQKKTCR